MRFGEKLREARKAKKYTQAQLAELAGLSLRTVVSYEQGTTYPKDRSIYKRLAEILGINVDYLHNENDDFISDAQYKYGARGRRQAEALLAEVDGLFSGGELAEEDKDEFMRAVQESYWVAKEKNRRKYTRKDYRKDD